MPEPTNDLMLTILRELQEGQTQMRDSVNALSEEVRATRRVLIDAFVQLEMRVARLETAKS